MSAHHDDDPAQVVASLVGGLAADLRGDRGGLVERLGRAGQQRAERIEAERLRLAGTLGEDHPRVAALQERGDLLRELGGRIDLTVDRGRTRPRRRPQEWVARGLIVDAEGRPLEGLTARVVDREGQLAEVLGDTETDADGAFDLPYHLRVFGDEPPELFLVVEDAQGQALVSSEPGVRPEPDRTDFFQVVVPAEPPAGPNRPPGPLRDGPSPS